MAESSDLMPHILGMVFIFAVLHALFSWVPGAIVDYWRHRND